MNIEKFFNGNMFKYRIYKIVINKRGLFKKKYVAEKIYAQEIYMCGWSDSWSECYKSKEFFTEKSALEYLQLISDGWIRFDNGKPTDKTVDI